VAEIVVKAPDVNVILCRLYNRGIPVPGARCRGGFILYAGT